jgi:prepilin-type N-terminal cleavage/methylation domain-containing protein
MKQITGFTLVEMVIVIALVAILFSISGVAYFRLQRSVLVQSGDLIVMQALTTAQRSAIAGENASSWGVYFTYDEQTRIAEHLTIFSGDSYETRAEAFDLPMRLSSSVVLDSVELSGAVVSEGDDHEVVFAYQSGEAALYGMITLSVYEESRIIRVSEEGFLTLEGNP